MEKIELRSEKVRNLVGIIPPFLIRLGNLFIFFLLMIILIIGSLIKVPSIISCNVQVFEQENTVQLAVVSISKLITDPIEKGKSVKIYKDGVLLFKGILDKKIDQIDITTSNFRVFIPISLPQTITTKEQMKLFLNNNSHLICEIEIDNQSIIKNIFKI
jgi:hypothetical protein